MEQKDLDLLRKKLLEEQEGISKQIKDLGEVPDMGSDTEGEVAEEEADEAEEYSKNLGIKQILKERLRDVESALDKISKGEYGKCESCEEEIGSDVLAADPESRFCKLHKKK